MDSQCDKILILQSVKTYSDERSQLSWLKIISSTTYEEAKRSADAAFEDLFTGSYDEFIAKREAYFLKNKFDYSTSDAKETLKSYLDTEQISAWLECMKLHESGVFSYFKDITQNGATLIVEWVPPRGAKGLRRIDSQLIGSTSDRFARLKALNGREIFLLERQPVGGSIRAAISGYSGETHEQFGCSILLPEFPDEVVPPRLPPMKLKIFESTSIPENHPKETIHIPPDYKVISGGAISNYSYAGNYLTSSYPVNLNTWIASSKDHDPADPCTIKVYAIAIYDPDDHWDVKIFDNTSQTNQAHPEVEVSVSNDYLMTGGGAKVIWAGHGNLLTASFPSSLSSWAARSKDHIWPSPATLAVYAIGIKPKNGAELPESKLFTETCVPINKPEQSVAVGNTFNLVGGGALDNWSGVGNMLTSSYPDRVNSWKASGKDHHYSSPAGISVYAIGVKKY